MLAQRSEPVRRFIEEQGLPFYILIDADRAASKAYGVWHRVGLDAWNIARPALFLVAPDRVIRAVWVAERQDEFPSAEDIDRALREGSSSGRPVTGRP